MPGGNPSIAGPVLPRPDEDHAGHAHLHVLHVLEVAVVHVGPGVVRAVEVGEVATHRYGERELRDPVEERDRVHEAVPVQGVAVEEVRTHLQAQVRQRDEDVVLLVEGQHRRADLRVAALRGDLLGGHPGDVAEAEDVGVQTVGRQRVGEERRVGRRVLRHRHPPVGADQVQPLDRVGARGRGPADGLRRDRGARADPRAQQGRPGDTGPAAEEQPAGQHPLQIFVAHGLLQGGGVVGWVLGTSGRVR